MASVCSKCERELNDRIIRGYFEPVNRIPFSDAIVDHHVPGKKRNVRFRFNNANRGR